MTNEPTAAHALPPSELELQAYIDGQLDPESRAAIEGHLAQNPEAAARIMGDLHLMSSLRAALQPLETASGSAAGRATLASARRLIRARKRESQWRRFLPMLPLIALIFLAVAGYQGHGPLSAGKLTASALPPDFVPAAISAHEASRLRLAMESQPMTPRMDAEELRAATGILLPRFPEDWQLRDVQVFPSPQGPGVELVIARSAPSAGLMTLFAIRPGDFAVTKPVSLSHEIGSIAWFQLGETAHVLISDQDDEKALAELASSLYARIH